MNSTGGTGHGRSTPGGRDRRPVPMVRKLMTIERLTETLVPASSLPSCFRIVRVHEPVISLGSVGVFQGSPVVMTVGDESI